MNKEKFFELIENPLKISQEDVNDLKELVEDYPYFHAAHLLLLKGLHSKKNLKFDQQLQKSAIHIADRKKLYKVLFYANDLFEQKIGEKDIQAEENLLEISSDPETTKIKEEPIELFEFTFEESEKEKELPAVDLLDYEYSPEVSNTFMSSDYFAAYNLEDNEPLDDVYINSVYTFDEWLKLMKKNKASKDNGSILPKKKENKQNELIENFIKERPKIIPKKTEEKAENTNSEESITEKSDFITETLAEIYTKQSHYAKAILAYEKLSLKYPEKNSYFADQIKKLEKLIKEQ